MQNAPDCCPILFVRRRRELKSAPSLDSKKGAGTMRVNDVSHVLRSTGNRRDTA